MFPSALFVLCDSGLVVSALVSEPALCALPFALARDWHEKC